jgi:hypothetical protein
VISIEDIANRELLDLVPYEPGKPVDDVARELGLDPASIIKLASNENPLGPSPLAMAAMRKAIERAHFYPDGGGFHLRNAIAENSASTRENVVLGNGSNEIIELLFHAFTRPGIHEIVTAAPRLRRLHAHGPAFRRARHRGRRRRLHARPARDAPRRHAADAPHFPRLARTTRPARA